MARPEGLYVGGRSKGSFNQAFTSIVRLGATGQLDAAFANAGVLETSLGQDAFDQYVFYGLAVADGAIGASSPLKRLSSPARTFVWLMAAALVAPKVLWSGAEGIWKPSGATSAPSGNR